MNTKDKDYYDALSDSYINTILQSGLLLDEDLQLLINYYKQEKYLEFPTYKPSATLKLCCSTFVCSLLLVKNTSKWIVLPAILAASLAAVVEIKNVNEKKIQKRLIEDIVNISKKTNSLNSSIKKYVKTRTEIEDKSQNDFFRSYNRQIHDFFTSMLVTEVKFFETIMKNIENISSYSDDLTDDFNSIKDFEPLNWDEIKFDNLETGLKFLIQIQDLHIWLTSKLLSYISIIFLCPNEKLHKNTIYSIINVNFPSLRKFLTQNYDSTRTLFFSLRTSVVKLNELRSQKPKPHISNKLHNTLISAVDNISIISEKSQTILTEIENNDGTPSAVLETALVDLRNHTYAAYESIDLLCRLYGILSSQNVPAEKPSVPPLERQKSGETSHTAIHHDDDINVLEENYELYLDKDYQVPAEASKSYKEDNSSAYLGLMLQELRQSLKKHERFIEAKKRRGSVDTEELAPKETVELPRFDLNALNVDAAIKRDMSVGVEKSARDSKDLVTSSGDNTNLSVISSVTSSIPPPPPPLPIESTFDLEKLGDTKPQSKSMFEGIKTLSSQLNMQEEVFGESGDEEVDNK